MRIAKRNGVYYIFYKKIDGKKSCKSCKTRKKAEALKFLTSFTKHLEDQKKIPDLTLSEFEKILLKKYSYLYTKKSISALQQSFKQFRKFAGDLLLKDVTQSIVENFISITFQRSSSACSLYHRNLKSSMNKAISMGFLEQGKNPFNQKLPRTPKNHALYLSKKELIAICEKEKSENLRATYLFAFNTGLRRETIVNLKWESINLRDQIVEVRNSKEHTLKGKNSQIIPMSKVIIELLTQMNEKRNSEYVFSKHDGSKFSGDFISKNFKKIVRELGLPEGIHFHSLRHSFASNLVQSGASIYFVKELLAHKSINTTMRYSHLSADNLKETIKLLD